MIIIGITGTIGAGKGVTVSYLKKRGFKHYSVRGFLIEELRRRKLSVNRDTMTNLANKLRREHEPSYIIRRLYEKALMNGKDCVIESVRATGEVEFLRSVGNFILLAVDSSLETRYKRIVKRNSALDHVTFEKFIFDDKREMNSDDPTKGNIAECIRMADFSLWNDGSFEDLYSQVDVVLKGIVRDSKSVQSVSMPK
jgi:dephospho-CoA kinase